MNTIVNRTISKEIVMSVEEHEDRAYLCIREDDEAVHRFDIILVWDLLIEELSKANIGDSLGLARRSYEAANIPLLTKMFLEEQE